VINEEKERGENLVIAIEKKKNVQVGSKKSFF